DRRPLHRGRSGTRAAPRSGWAGARGDGRRATAAGPRGDDPEAAGGAEGPAPPDRRAEDARRGDPQAGGGGHERGEDRERPGPEGAGAVAITAGKFPNPIFRTDEMVFDEDLSLEGASETFQLLAHPLGALDQVKVHALQWTYSEVANKEDGWMFGGQVNPSLHLGSLQ